MGSKSQVTKIDKREIRKDAAQDEYAHNMTLLYTGMLLARQGLVRDSSILGKDRDKFLSLLEKVEKGALGRCPYVLGNLPEINIDEKTKERLNWTYPHPSKELDVGEEVRGSYGFIASKLGVPLTKNDIVDIVAYFWGKKNTPHNTTEMV